MGKVCLVHRDVDPVRFAGQLCCGIDDAAVILVAVFGSENEQTVGELEHGIVIDGSCSYFHAGFCLGRALKFRNRGSDRIHQSINFSQLVFPQGGFQSDGLIQNGHVLTSGENPTHQAAAGRCPGAIFYQGDGTVLNVVGSQVVKQFFHGNEDSCIVCGGSEDQMAPLKCGRNDLAGRCNGYIVHYGTDSLFPQPAGDDLGRIFGVSVYRRIGNHHAVFFRCVGAPLHIFIEIIFNTGSPDETVKRADHLDIQTMGLFQQGLYLHAVFAYDIGVVAAGFIHVIMVEIHFICENGTVQCTEGTEGVSREENFIGGIICNHDFRPVNHWRHDELEIVTSGVHGGAFLHDESLFGNVQMEKLVDHGNDLFVADDGYIRIAEKKFCQGSRVVRFHVLYYQEIQVSAAQSILQVLEEFVADCLVYSIEENG